MVNITGKRFLSLALGLVLTLGILFCFPVQDAEAADTIRELVDRLDDVYRNLDNSDIQALQDARSGTQQLSDAELKAIINPLLTGEVWARLGQDAEDTLVSMIRDFCQIYYSENASVMEERLRDYKEKWQKEGAKLLNPGTTIDALWEYLIDVEDNLPEAIEKNIAALADFISGKSYDEMVGTFTQILEDAMTYALDDNQGFKGSLAKLGWSVSMLVDVKNAIRDEVDKNKLAEQALIKGYIRSVTVPVGSTSLTVGDRVTYDLKVLDKYLVPSSVPEWWSSDTSIASFEDKVLVAKSQGTVTVKAYHPKSNPDTGWVTKFMVTVSPRSTTPSGGDGAAPPTTPTTPPAEEKPGQVDITSSTTIEKTTAPDGTVTLSARVDAAAVNEVLAEKPEVKEVAVKLEAADRQEVNVPAQAFTALAGYKAALVIESPAAAVVLPGAAVNVATLAEQLGVDAGKIDIRVQVTKLPVSEAQAVARQAEAQEAGLKAVGPVMEFSVIAQAEGKTITVAFGRSRVRAEMALDEKDLSLVGNTARLGAYRQDETTGRLNYVPSRYDAATKRILFLTRGFSRYAVLEYEKTFADIKDHWARENIETLASHRVIKGVTPENFEPERAVTRAEFAALLVRALDLVPGEETKTFSDVAAGAWYADVIAIASSNGLIYGYEDGTFRPKEKISREEMAAMLVRALNGMGVEIKAQPEMLAKFKDAGEIQGWAKTVVSQTVASGLMLGISETEFAPQDEATRAQAATVVYRLREKPEMWQ
ncbi:MAG: N-acetylmuramoyl-L-alanine amidase [Clostridia bacterium]|nr:N-acetylmuramoyl-L-alanine amidase [Clostridia bacterium]